MATASTVPTGFLTAFPLIAIVIVIYNILVVVSPISGGGDTEPAAVTASDSAAVVDEDRTAGTATQNRVEALLERHVGFPLISGDYWKLRLADIILIVGLILLLLEVLRATATSGSAIINHSLSLILFIIALVEFIVLPGFGTSTFFLLTFMCLFDVIAGFTIGIVAARRDLGVAPGVVT